MLKKWDVIIVGGGISGACAAISAARCGCKTLVVEQHGFLGGVLTAAGVGPMMSFHAGEKQVVQGIAGELIEKMKSNGKSTGHIFDTTGYTYTVTPFDAEGMKHELEKMLLESGGELLYHSFLAGVNMNGKEINYITVCNKAGVERLFAKVFIDATGDADLSAWSGVEYAKGRPSDGASQPLTANIKIRNVDINRIKEFIKANPADFPRLKGDVSLVDKAPRLSASGFIDEMKEARKMGEITFNRDNILFFETNNPGEVIVNTTRIQGYDSTDPWALTKAEIEGRRQARELEAFLKSRVAGFEQSIIQCTGYAVGVRSSRNIKGIYTLTAEDLFAGKQFDDVIAHGGYPIDIHAPSLEDNVDCKSIHFPYGHVYSIPYRALISNMVDNLIVVGRCISATFEAQASIRVSPISGAIGHAGGAAASIAVRDGVSVQSISTEKVQNILVSQGAYLELKK
ncbi:MAG: FAD-dependent oxidoreductase [Firmicutes bacterium]|nr:FAD-dependent oxidoreductase [Bacillota bacterium]